MRVDLRQCQRCHGHYDANLVPDAYDIKHPLGYPIDLCRHCTGMLASLLSELPEPTDDMGDGVHLGTMVTREHLDRVNRSMSDYINDLRVDVNARVDEYAAEPLIIP